MSTARIIDSTDPRTILRAWFEGEIEGAAAYTVRTTRCGTCPPLYKTRREAVAAAIRAARADSPGGEAAVCEQPPLGHHDHHWVFRLQWPEVARYRSTPRGYRKVPHGG